MLNNIRIHTAKTKALWFNAPDIAKLLSIRTDNLLARKSVVARKFKTSGILTNYVNEPSFILLFKDNTDILAELDQYKLTGELTHSDKYSNLLTIAYFYICADVSKPELILKGFVPLNKSLIAKNTDKPEVALALLQVFLNVLFNDTDLQDSSQIILGLLVKEFPIGIDSAFLKDIFFGKEPPQTFIKALCAAKPQNLTAFRTKVYQHLDKTAVRLSAEAAITRALSDVNSVFGVNTWSGKDKSPLHMHHFQYPRILEPSSLPDYLGEAWLGE